MDNSQTVAVAIVLHMLASDPLSSKVHIITVATCGKRLKLQSGVSIMTTFDDIPFFFCGSIFHEAQNMFELPNHRTPGSMSTCNSRGSCESGVEYPSRYVNDTSSPIVSPATVSMRDLEHHWPSTSGDDDRGSDLSMSELRDEMLYLRQRDQNL